ncbi:MAG: hypothetical protein EXR66_02495 [Dehalococcoidia bacterium]|nr:hypothetical protein [Dehalococcoidia bacterium]
MHHGLALGWVLYLLGAAGAAGLVWANAATDTALAHIEAPAAPALDLYRGTYVLRPSASARVFALSTRAGLDLRAAEGSSSFEVECPGIYIVELLNPGD